MQKSNGEPEQSEGKNTSRRVNLEWFAIHPHRETFITVTGRNPLSKKFKTLGILEVEIKCVTNREESYPCLDYQHTLYL